jgi:uncharacterized protein
MLFELSRVSGSTGHIERTYPPEAFAAEDEYRVGSPVTLSFDVVKSDRRFTLTGRVVTTLDLACSRCAEPVVWPVDLVFDLTYLPQQTEAEAGEFEIAEEDLGVAYYTDETIDLGHLMREQFYLVVPMKPLCTDDCLGLCPTCGANRNAAPCACTSSWTDPRLEGLKDLFRTKDDA